MLIITHSTTEQTSSSYHHNRIVIVIVHYHTSNKTRTFVHAETQRNSVYYAAVLTSIMSVRRNHAPSHWCRSQHLLQQLNTSPR